MGTCSTWWNGQNSDAATETSVELLAIALVLNDFKMTSHGTGQQSPFCEAPDTGDSFFRGGVVRGSRHPLL